MKILTGVIAFSLLLGYSQECLPMPASIGLDVTGFSKSLEGDLTVSVHTSLRGAHQTFRLSHSEDRDRYGKYSKTIELQEDIAQISYVIVIGRLRSDTGSVKGYLPLRFVTKGEFNDRGYAKVRMSGVLTTEVAFANSYPFSENQDIGFVNAENVDPTLLSTKLLIESHWVTADQWQRIFSLLYNNLGFFAERSDKISAILTYLKSYKSLTRNKDYTAFYVEFLNRLEELNIDGTVIEGAQTLEDYIFNEFIDVFTNDLAECLSKAGLVERTYRKEHDSLSCIKVSGVVFNGVTKNAQIQQDAKSSENTKDFILSAMQAATECVQHHFKLQAENGNLDDVELAAAFAVDQGDETRSAVESYVALFELVESWGWIPRVPSADASRLKEIAKYYEYYKKAL